MVAFHNKLTARGTGLGILPKKLTIPCATDVDIIYVGRTMSFPKDCQFFYNAV